MKFAVLREDEGFDILVNGVPRTFRDGKQIAYASARQLKAGICRQDIVEIRDRSAGTKVIMLEDGRTG